MNRKVFSKFFGFALPKDAYTAAAFCEAGAIEKILKLVRSKLAEYQTKNGTKRASTAKSLAVLHDIGKGWRLPAKHAAIMASSEIRTPPKPRQAEFVETFHSPKSSENNDQGTPPTH